MKISSLIMGLYIFYMFNYFKTTYSIHHPFEYLFSSKLLKHPIRTGKYESKICLLGNYVGMFLLVWYCLRDTIHNKYCNKLILYTLVIGSFIMNMNAFIYVLPLVLIDLI
jgi:hypothetical protein